jgi:hypothetical protein
MLARHIFKTLTLPLLVLCLLSAPRPLRAEEQTPTFPPAASDMSGDWKVLMENDNGHKVLHFHIEEKDGRLRGKLTSREAGTQDLDGRRGDDGEILFWSTFYDRGGASTENNFKAKLEGETLVGEGRFFRRNYRFRAERYIPQVKRHH